MKKSKRVTEIIKESKAKVDELSFHKIKPLLETVPPQIMGREKVSPQIFITINESYTDVMLAMTGGGVLIGFALAGAMR